MEQSCAVVTAGKWFVLHDSCCCNHGAVLGGCGGQDVHGGGTDTLMHLVPRRKIGSHLTISTDASSCSGRTKHIRSLEHVQVQLSLSYSRRGDLAIALTSPMGTTSMLVTVR